MSPECMNKVGNTLELVRDHIRQDFKFYHKPQSLKSRSMT